MTVAATEEGPLLDGRRSAERELELLYVRHAEDVRRQIRAVLRNPSDVEDALQQTFLKALRALQSGIRPERPRQWLCAIARNECLMQFRAEARRPAQVVLEEVAERAPSPDGPRAEEIREALAQLRPAQRAALVLRELEGRGYAEIAETLGISSSAVETLLFRARRALREQLAAAGCDEAAELLAVGTLTEAQRGALRAHLRSCSACATLERRRRGRLAAVRRIASLVPLPGWLSPLLGGGGKAAVAVAVAAVAAGGAAEVVRSDPAPARPAAATPIVHRDAVRRAVAFRPAAPVARAAAPAPRRTKPARRASRPRDGIVEPVERLPRAQPAPGIVPLPDPPIEHPRPRPAPKRPTPQPPAVAPAVAAPAAAPEPTPPPPAATVTVAAPAVPSATVTVPAVTAPSVTTPVVTTPAVTTPTVTVTTPAVAVPTVTVPVPQPPAAPSLTQP